MKSLDERSHTFVIRIWQERRDFSAALPVWRGRVDDVRAGSRAYFTSLEQLMDYFTARALMESAACEVATVFIESGWQGGAA
jgi:hypothetical protein